MTRESTRLWIGLGLQVRAWFSRPSLQKARTAVAG